MDAKLILLAEDGRTGEFKLKLPVIMGRSRQAGLTVMHSSVSRQHCELSEYEGQLVANDLGSLNGTFIEETRIAEPTILPDGGLLRVGSVRFQAVYGSGEYLAPPEVPIPESAQAAASTTPSAMSNSTVDNLLPPGATGADPMQPAVDWGQEELELSFDEEVPGQAASAPPETDPMEFLGLDEPEATAPATPEAAKPAATAKTPAPAPAPRRAPAPAPAKAPAPAPAKAPAPEDQTVSFVPGAPGPQTEGEALADDLDSFFKSLE